MLADEFNADLPPEPVEDGTHLDCVYHRRRLPIGSREDFHICLDFAPGPRGAEGQVLLLGNECDFAVVGTNITDFFHRWLDELASPQCIAGRDPAYWLRNDTADWAHFFLDEQQRREQS